MIVSLAPIAIAIYLVFVLEKFVRLASPNNKLLLFTLRLIESQIIISSLVLIFPVFLWVQVAMGVLAGLAGLRLANLILEDLECRTFPRQLMVEHRRELERFKALVAMNRGKKGDNCPIGFVCADMGLKDDRCENFHVCNGERNRRDLYS